MSQIAVILLPFLIMGTVLAEPIITKGLAPTIPSPIIEKQGSEPGKHVVIGKDSLLALNSVNYQQGKAAPAKKVIKIILTAYTSSPEETDDTPNITASGSFTREGVAAANFLPIGTKIRIPELFGGKIFVIEDRLHSRYSDRIDIWFSDKKEALDFGLKISDVEIL